jgi:nitrous oxidase accessory protein
MTSRLRAPIAAVLGALMLLVSAAPVDARTVRVPAFDGALAQALGRATPGDTLALGAGRHRGAWAVRVPITMRGEPGAVLDGGGRGSVLEIAAPGARVEDLEIRGSGRRVLTVDSGVRVIAAPDVTLRRIRGRDLLYGISVERSDRLRIEDCDLEGRVHPLDESGEGNGIHLWYCHDAVIENDRATHFTDGIYLSFADDTRVAANHLHENGRYGLHTMYCQRTRLEGNVFEHNVAGIAIMFSNGLAVERNLMIHNRGPRTYGLLLRDCSAGVFQGNQLVDNTVGIFMDNSNRNRIRRNLLQDDGWGVILFSSCAGNEFAGNDFINDDYPLALDMRRTDNRFDDGRHGNYWSGSAPYDLDGDRVSDVPYAPVSAFAFVSKQYPDLSVLAKSPAVAALAVAERVFPSLRPSEAVDRFPAVRPVTGLAGVPREPGARSPSWAAFAFFVGLLGLGLGGLARGRLAP